MRNLLGLDVAVVCGYCGRAPLSTGTAARLCASKPARALHTGPSDTLHTGPSGALHAGGAWCPVGEPQLCLVFGTKFSLLSFLVVRTVHNSPCMRRLRQIGPFRVSRESFIPEMRRGRACRESFVPHMRCEGVCWESFVPEVGPCGSCWARFVSPWHLPRVQLPGFHHPPVPHPGPPAPAAHSTLVAVGVLRHAKPSGGVSPACRTLAWRNSPRLVAARPWFAVVWRPNRRPPR